MTDPSLVHGPVTILIAPVDTPIPETISEIVDPDGPWQLLYPTCPDTPGETE